VSGGIKDVLSIISGALVLMVAVLVIFGVETNRRSLEEIAAVSDVESLHQPAAELPGN